MDAARHLAVNEDRRPPEPAARPTPMMEQYIEIKAANPDCLLFYRMGDFYELFFEDAEVASRALGIVLTKRGKHLGRDIPMCGVPVIRSDEYLHRLIALGHRVAVCEQTEDPAEAKKRGGKSVVRRDVVRLVTPGTLTEDTLLDARRNNYLLAIARARASADADASRFALAWIDISTGEFRIAECDRAGLPAEIARLEPGEIIVSDALYGDPELAPYLRTLPAVTPLTRDVFDGATAERRLSDYFAVATTEAFGTLSRLELNAAAACVTYVERTQLGKRPPLSPPLREAQGATLSIDQATRANLELMRTLARRAARLAARRDRPHRDGGGLAAAGAAAGRAADRSGRDRRPPRRRRRFRRRRARPPGDPRASPRRARPGARAVAARGRPRRAARPRRDPRRHRAAAASSPRGSTRCRDKPAEIAGASRRCAQPDPALAARAVRRARRRAAAVQARRRLRPRGLSRPRSTNRARCATNRARWSPRCRRATPTTPACKSLKIRHNNVLGYFVDVTAQHGDKLLSAPLNATFIHRQTLAGQVRFTTTELGELEAKIASAADRALGLELEIFERLAAAVIAASADDQGRRRGARRARCGGGARHARGRARLRAAGGRPLARFRHRGRPPSGGRAGAQRSVRRQRLRSVAAARMRAPGASGCSPARTWPASRRSCARTR